MAVTDDDDSSKLPYLMSLVLTAGDEPVAAGGDAGGGPPGALAAAVPGVQGQPCVDAAVLGPGRGAVQLRGTAADSGGDAWGAEDGRGAYNTGAGCCSIDL